MAKLFFGFVWGAVLASSWWAACRWGFYASNDNGFGLLWVPPALLTVVTIGSFLYYVCENWERD